jgi:hypothetical protein
MKISFCTLLVAFLLPLLVAANNTPISNIIATFNASIVNENGKIQWQTSAQGQQVLRYEVEKSIDGVHFSYVTAIASSKDVYDYAVTDRNVLWGKNYYRIKIVSNTSTIYSNVIVLNKTPKATIAPAVVTNSVQIWVPTNVYIHTAIIKDALGNIIKQQQQLVNNPNMSGIVVKALQKGSYTVKLLAQNGDVTNLQFTKK